MLISIVLLNWNSFEDSDECIQSILEAQPPPGARIQIVVVDNGSSDDSGQRLQQEYPRVLFEFNDGNLGFSGGCNVGIKRALEEGADYVLLLNNDTIVAHSFLGGPMHLMEGDQSIGIVGGKIFYHHEPRRIWSAGGRIDWLRGGAVHFRRGEVETNQVSEFPREVGFLTGALMLIRRKVFEDVGLLPEEYFLGSEEWDFCVSVRKAGYTLWYDPSCVIWHKVGKSHDKYTCKSSGALNTSARFNRADKNFMYADPMHLYNWYRNKLLFQRRNLSRWIYGLWYTFFHIYAFSIRFKLPRAIHYSHPSLVARAIQRALDDHRKFEEIRLEQLLAARAALTESGQ